MSHGVQRRFAIVLATAAGLVASVGLIAALGLTGPAGAETNEPPKPTPSPSTCDPGPVRIDDFIMWDGPNPGMTEVPVSWRRACPMPREITFRTFDITARAGRDYVAVLQGTLTLAAGTTRTTIRIQIIGDTLNEGTESFGIRLISGAQFERAEAIVTLRDR